MGQFLKDNLTDIALFFNITIYILAEWKDYLSRSYLKTSDNQNFLVKLEYMKFPSPFVSWVCWLSTFTPSNGSLSLSMTV